MIFHAGATKLYDTTKATYIFDPETNHFSQVDPPIAMDIRLYPAVAYVDRPDLETDLLFMFGGLKDTTACFDDLWKMVYPQGGNQRKLRKKILNEVDNRQLSF